MLIHFRDVRASTVHETVSDGSYVFSRNAIVLGSNVARDLGGAEVGDSVKVLVVDRWGEDQIRRFTVVRNCKISWWSRI